MSGIGGQGKTTLAREVCGNLSEAIEPWESIMVSLRLVHVIKTHTHKKHT